MRARSTTRSSISSAARRARSSKDFRGYKGAQSYPSRTKDADDVDFSTGSVGLGVAQTLFASLVQDYVRAAWLGDRAAREGRMIALVGDAEMDEGNIFEALLEGWKQGLRNCWWIIDYNRQSLDAVVREGLWARFEAIFRRLRLGGRDPQIRLAADSRPSPSPAASKLRAWIDNCPNQLYSALDLPGRRGLAQAPPRRDRRSGSGHAADRHALRRGAGAADDQSRRPRPAERCSMPSEASSTTARSVSSPTRSRASACRSPATRTTTPA